MKYSALSLIRDGLSSVGRPTRILQNVSPKKKYEVVVIGGGAHGLACAHYLARNYDITNVAVLDSGWIGGGNTARNTSIVRSDYLLDSSFKLKNFSLQLWKTLSQELNYNVMYSPRGYIDLAHSDGELESFSCRANAMCLGGANAQILTPKEIEYLEPSINLHAKTRFPISGALYQPDGGLVRHDAVAWGFARSASNLGVDIVQNCHVSGFGIQDNCVTSVETDLGRIFTDKVLISAAGQSAKLAQRAGFELPVEMINVQAFVSEPVKPVLKRVVNYNAGLSYVSQTDKGEFVMGGASDGYPSFARRGGFARIEDTVVRTMEIFPFVSKLRLMRHWSGTADIPMDGNGIVGQTPIKNLYINCGWGYAGFKATPAVGWTMAELIATDHLPELLKPFSLDRFERGALIDDAGVGPYPWLH